MAKKEAAAAESTEVKEESGLSASLQATVKQVDEKFADDVKSKIPTASQGDFDQWWPVLLEYIAGTDEVRVGKNAIKTLDSAIAVLDAMMSDQLNEIMHNPEFLKLEGTWSGLHHLVFRTMSDPENLYIDILNCKKEELEADLETAVGNPQMTAIYKKTYSDSFNIAGGVPFGILVGDYEFTNHPDDIEILRGVSKLAASSHTPFVTSPGPGVFGLDNFEQLENQNNVSLANIFDNQKYAAWNALRDSEDSRYLVMAMPRVMARLPYGSATKKVKDFNFEEAPLNDDGEPLEMEHDKFCWMNASYALAERITNAFWEYGWCSAIRGEHNGGKVEELPLYTFRTPAGDLRTKCPCEVNLNWNQDFALSNFGFYSMVHVKGKAHTRFEGAQTLQKPKAYVEADANDSAKLSTGLPYILAASRVAHYLKRIAHEHIGTFKEREDCENWLNDWIMQYVELGENPSDKVKASHPFKAAKVVVNDVPGEPGVYDAQIMVAPWIFLEKLTADITLVSRLGDD